MNSIVRKLMAIALLVCSQPAVADDLLFTACSDWEVGVQALYFTPITCPFDYASVFTGTNTQRGQAQLVPCRADWGFRIFGNYLNDCMFAGVSYQWLDVTTDRSVVADTNLGTPGGLLTGPGRAAGQVAIEYQNVNLKAGKYFLQGCASVLYLYGNARWIDLAHRRAIRAVFTAGGIVTTHEESQLRGGAVGIGVGGEFDVWCGVGAFVDGNILGVIGNRSLSNVEFKGFNPGFTPQVRRAEYPSETCVIPEVDLRIGINYSCGCGCWKLVGEVGYEVDYFWNGSIFPGLTGTELGLGGTREFVPACQNIGFSGLFFGARLVF